jgi:hypothetical protein
MQALKHRIYGNHLRRRLAQQEPNGYEDPDDPNLDEQERDRLRGFSDPRNTVGVTVPIANQYGEIYGSRVDLISPEETGRRIDGDRETITHLREALHEARFWWRFMTKVSWISLVFNVIFIAILIGG